MSKQLIFVLGSPYSGRSTWINKNLYNVDENMILIDANTYENLYTKTDSKDLKTKISEESIEQSRLWALEKVHFLMTETTYQTIILSLIACRPDRLREFIQLAIDNEYEINFKFPSNKLLFYYTKHNTSLEQFKFIESKIIHRYPRDKKEVRKPNSKIQDDLIFVETNESTLLRSIINEFESCHAFYLSNRIALGTDKIKWLEKINQNYKIVINANIKKAEKKVERENRETEKMNKAIEIENLELENQVEIECEESNS
jgi:predicted kinase